VVDSPLSITGASGFIDIAHDSLSGHYFAINGDSGLYEISSDGTYIGATSFSDSNLSYSVSLGIPAASDTKYIFSGYSIYFVDSDNNLVKVIPEVTGDYKYPRLVATDGAGNVWVHDDDSSIYVSDPDGSSKGYRNLVEFAPDKTKITTRQVLTSSYDPATGASKNFSPYGSMVALPDGTICASGNGSASDGVNSQSYAMACYPPDSDEPQFLTPSYDDTYSLLYCQSLAYDAADDQFICAGSISKTENDTSAQYAYARINRDGSIAEFGPTKSYVSNPDGSYYSLSTNGVAIASDGTIYMTGYYSTSDGTTYNAYSLWKIDPSSGEITPIEKSNKSTDTTYTSINYYAVAVDDLGNIYAGGNHYTYDNATNAYAFACAVTIYDAGGAMTGCAVPYDISGEHSGDPAYIGYINNGGLAVSDTDYSVYAVDSNNSLVKKYVIESTIPSAPLNVAANNPTMTTIDVKWDAPASDGYSRITGYKVQYRVAGTESWQTVEIPADVFATTLTGLSPDTNYEIQVLAKNVNGLSVASNLATAKTLAELVVPGAPNTGFREL
jgi:hypothetical protein